MKKLKYFSVIMAFFGVLGLSIVIFKDGITNIDRNMAGVYACSAVALIGFVLLGACGIVEIISIVRAFLRRNRGKQV